MSERRATDSWQRHMEDIGGARTWEFKNFDMTDYNLVGLKVVELPGEPPCDAFECFGAYGERLGTLKADDAEEKERAAEFFDGCIKEHMTALDVFYIVNYYTSDHAQDHTRAETEDMANAHDYEEVGGEPVDATAMHQANKADTYAMFRHNAFLDNGWETVDITPRISITRTELLRSFIPKISALAGTRPIDAPQREMLDMVVSYESWLLNEGTPLILPVTWEMLGKAGFAAETLHEASMRNAESCDDYKRILVDHDMNKLEFEDIAQGLPLDQCIIEYDYAPPIFSTKHMMEIASMLTETTYDSDDLYNYFPAHGNREADNMASYYVLNVTPKHTLVARADAISGKEELDSLMEKFRDEYPDEEEFTKHPYFYDAKKRELALGGGLLMEAEAAPQAQGQRQATRSKGR